jgi:hypothetical protein
VSKRLLRNYHHSLRNDPEECIFHLLSGGSFKAHKTQEFVYRDTANVDREIYDHKGKAIPLQAWTGPEGSRRLRLPDFKTIGTLRW